MKKEDKKLKIAIRFKSEEEISEDQENEMWSQLFNVLDLFEKENKKLNMKYEKHFRQQMVQ